ncbi:MAG: glycosyltransferase family 4 protein [Gammaproteobacteria bacterium]|nr:glycosyltransferase family 4 protein [Gammaproteobacteria bacterium]MBU1481684.1 glycosyltransferase family 4 protein [Gammaproteobacteria bacterium]
MSYITPIITALCSVLLIAIILASGLYKNFQDVPNERSLHSLPIPRIGGVGLTAGVLGGWMFEFTSLMWWVVLPLVGLFILSLFDDIRGLPVRLRMLAHIVAAAILVGGSGLYTSHGLVAAMTALLLTVWVTNLYNFMDGSDGLAGGMGLIGFAFYGVAALHAHNETLATLCFAVSAAALGFLFHNFPPAKVFMGDAGSIPLGFLVAAMGLWGWQQGCWTVWFPLLVFSPFIADASVTLIKRTLRGVKITEAHREHYYQRAILLGWSHRKLALIEYLLMLASGMAALSSLNQSFPWLILLVCLVGYGALMLPLDRAWNKYERGQHA